MDKTHHQKSLVEEEEQEAKLQMEAATPRHLASPLGLQDITAKVVRGQSI